MDPVLAECRTIMIHIVVKSNLKLTNERLSSIIKDKKHNSLYYHSSNTTHPSVQHIIQHNHIVNKKTLHIPINWPATDQHCFNNYITIAKETTKSNRYRSTNPPLIFNSSAVTTSKTHF